MVENNHNNANAQAVGPGQGQNAQDQGLDVFEVVRMLVLMISLQLVANFIFATLGIGQGGSGGIEETFDQNSIFNGGMNQTEFSMQSAASEGYVAETTIPARTSKVPAGVSPNEMIAPSKKKKIHTSLWSVGTIMDLDLFITENEKFPHVTSTMTVDLESKKNKNDKNPSQILASWHEKDIVFDFLPTNHRNSSLTFDISDRMKSNETTLYAHLMLKRRKANGEDSEGEKDVLRKTFELTKFKLRKKKRNEKNLLGEHEDDKTKDKRLTYLELKDDTLLGKATRDFDRDVTLLYVKPMIDLQLVNFHQPFGRGTFNTDALALFDFYRNEGEKTDKDDDRDSNSNSIAYAVTADTGELADYYPIMYPSEFWMKDDSLIPVNGTLKNVTITLNLNSIQMWKFTIMAQMEQQWRLQEAMSPGSSDSDMFRSLLLDTNPILLIVTFVVTVLHSILDFLAFKNDITFFKGKRSMEGLSVKSMVINTFFQVVIFLYLMDNDTSTMILVSNGIGLLIEFWKITKAIKFTWEEGRLQWKETSSYSESKTKEYDEIATSHLLFVTLPLVLGYGIYSLVHQKHKGWHSWILSTLVGFIYMFGFVMMTPQLFINYKLQSVAHLNWRTMTYKSVNTFIDDLFAFVVKMPIMHRLACLRDDVIFVVYLYQRYKYRTDYTRINEYGQCEKPTEEMIKEKEAEEKKIVMSSDQSDSVSKVVDKHGDKQNMTTNTLRRRGAREKVVNDDN